MKLVSKIANTKLNYEVKENTVNTSKNNIKNMVNSFEVKGYAGNIKTDIVSEYNLNFLADDGIFNPNNNYYTEFGGNQVELIINIENYIKDSKIRDIITKYYPEADLSADNLELLFYRMNSVGCGYVAAINTILKAYERRDEKDFYARFGFPPYILRKDELFVHQMYKDYNYEYLFLDFFLYYAKNERGFNTLEEAIGNTEEEMEFRNNQAGDLALGDKDFVLEGMAGTNRVNVAEVMQRYLAEKGIELNIENKEVNNMLPFTLEDENFINKIIHKADDEVTLYRPISVEDIQKIISVSNQVIIAAENFTLYYPYDLDGNGKYDDVYNSNIGGHAMVATGTTDEGKIIVSSWGKEYLLDANDQGIYDFIIYDYDNFNPVET